MQGRDYFSNNAGQGNMVMSLSKMRVGQKGRIHRVELPADYEQRLAELGMMPGADIEVVRVAPLGDPIAVECQGMCVGMRLSEAGSILVESK
jgi:Fe2+ transport system protein FeoA